MAMRIPRNNIRDELGQLWSAIQFWVRIVLGIPLVLILMCIYALALILLLLTSPFARKGEEDEYSEY